MTHQAVIEKTSDNRFRATPLNFPECEAIGDTRDQALQSARQLLQQRLKEVEVAPLHLDSGENPWLKRAGMFQDDPTFDEYLAEIENYRRSLDEAEETSAEIPARHRSLVAA